MKKNIKKVITLSLILTLLIPSPTFALTKEETVYSKLNSDGSVKKILVNEHIINNDNSKELIDLTDLENIVNINSDDKFNLSDNKLSFTTNENDIFYQGTTTKNLPISLNITYKLENKEIKLDDLIGKKGHVEINIKYTNNSKNYIDGETLYTPFLVTTVTNFNNANNSNIEVVNGKVVDNGLGYSIIGLSSPGLYESLGLNELKNLDYVTINLDTTKFELPSIYSVITPKIIDSSDLDIFNKLDTIY